MEEKVFCKYCRWYAEPSVSVSTSRTGSCLCDNIPPKYDWFGPYRPYPSALNAKNDCPYFESKERLFAEKKK